MKKTNEKKNELLERLNDKILPLLTIDNRWHELFSYLGKTATIDSLEKKEEEYILDNARINDEINELRKNKKVLMAKFIKNEGTSGIKAANSKNEEKKDELDEYAKEIDRINEQLEKCKEKQKQAELKLEECNIELVVETLLALDEALLANEKKVDEINKYIEETKNEIKKQILVKHDLNAADKNIYAYMHDIVGSQIMQEFDGVTEYKIKRKKRKQAQKKAIIKKNNQANDIEKNNKKESKPNEDKKNDNND